MSVSSAQTEPADPSPAAVVSATRDRLVADISRQPVTPARMTLTRTFYAPNSNKEKACVEVIAARERRKHEPPLAFWDRFHLDVAIAGKREIHSWSAWRKRRGRGPLRIEEGLSRSLVLPSSYFSIYSSAAFWKANLTGDSSPFLKLDRWIIMINATPLFMSIQT